MFGESPPSVGLFGKRETKPVSIKKLIKNPVEIICHAGALMKSWTGLFAEMDRKSL